MPPLNEKLHTYWSKEKTIIQIFTKLYKMIELGLFYYLVYQITITKSHYQENNKSIKLLIWGVANNLLK